MLRANLNENLDSVGLMTVTAEGGDALPCSAVTCGEKGPHPQRSKDGCRVDAAHAVRWNRSAQRRWSEVHRRAVQRVRRETGLSSPLVASAWQLQQRGVFHLHVVLAFGSEAEKIATKVYVAAVKELAPQPQTIDGREYRFGFVDFRDRAGKAGRATVMEARRAAGYISRYVGDSSQLVQAVATADRPRRLIYVARRLTGSSGVTMTNLRRARLLWWIRNGGSSYLDASGGLLPKWCSDDRVYRAVNALLSPAPT